MFEFLGCDIDVPAQHMSAIVRVESAAYPFSVGVVGNSLNRQPKDLEEAKQLVSTLQKEEYNFSVGLAQVNKNNFAAFGLSEENMFNKCDNLKAGSQILNACYKKYDDWSKAYSCYYSGNDTTGFSHGYVQKVLSNINKPVLTKTVLLSPANFPISINPRGGSHKGTVTTESKPSLKSRRLASSLSSIS